MNDGQLRKRLTLGCPWWLDSENWAEDDPDLRSIRDTPIEYEPEPLRDITPPGLYVLRGPRRIGKSVEIKRAVLQLLKDGAQARTIFFVNCDNLRLQDLRRIILVGNRDTAHLEGPRYWFIDEVTAVKDWSSVVKDLRDQSTPFKESCVVLSGSSARDLRAATSHLADRRGGAVDSNRLLLPMTFRDFCRTISDTKNIPNDSFRPRDLLSHRGQEAARNLLPWWSELDDRWQLFLQVGGFPRAVSDYMRYGQVRPAFINGLSDILFGDAFSSTSMSEAEIKAFIDRLVQNISNPLNASYVARDSGLPDNQAVELRINSLVLSFLAWRCYRQKGTLPNLAAWRKIYFIDPLIARLMYLQDGRYTDPDISLLAEQQIGLALARSLMNESHKSFLTSSELMYERTQTRSEIDFVGPRLETPFESKYVDDSWLRDSQPMRATYGCGIVVTRSVFNVDEELDADTTVWAIPAGMVAWLLDGSSLA